MIKAIFMDYYGTITYDMGPIAVEVIKKIYKSGNASSIEEVVSYWWTTFHDKVAKSNGENFQTQHQIALDNFYQLIKHFHCNEDPVSLLGQMEEHWRTTLVYEDVKVFLDKVKLPIYFVTNSDDDYVYSNMKRHNIHVAGVITSEQAKYSKPRKEIFTYALEKIGLKPEEVIHIGDSLENDVKCPGSIGIHSLWLNRNKEDVPVGIESLTNLLDIFHYLED